MSSYPKIIVQTFDNYAKSQATFVQNISELAAKPLYVECLYENHVVEIVMPLVTSTNAVVRMNVVLCLARLAGNSESCLKQMMSAKSLLNRLFGQITKENKYYKKNCMHFVKNLSKYSPVYTEMIIKECGGIDAIFICMKDFDMNVRESALQAINSIARQDTSISLYIVSSGVLLPLINLCLKEPQQNLRLYALSTLDEMAKQNQDLAQIIVDVPTLPHITHLLSSNTTDVKVQRSALTLLKNIVKHSLLLTENAIEANLFPELLLLLMGHVDEAIRNNAAKVIREIVKHGVQIAQMIVNHGGIASLLNVISCSKNFTPTPAIITLGYIAAMSPLLASAVIQSEALMHMTAILKSDADNFTKIGTVWALGMIGQHSVEHSRPIYVSDAVTTMIDIYTDSNLEDESRNKCRVALQLILKVCDDFTVLENLLTPSIPVEIMTFVLDQISKILPKNSKARRSFMTNGHLKMIQNVKPEIDSMLYKVIKAVNCCFPEDIIQMVTGDFPETVMTKVDKYVPKSQCLFYKNQVHDDHKSNKSTVKIQKSIIESSFE